MSTGFCFEAAAGRKEPSSSRVASGSRSTLNPAASRASAQRMAGPPELVTMPNDRPRGRGCVVRARAMPNISSRVPALRTPVWRKRASTATSEPARAAVWEPAALPPASLRPDLTTTIGLERPTRRAMRAKRRGRSKDSR